MTPDLQQAWTNLNDLQALIGNVKVLVKSLDWDEQKREEAMVGMHEIHRLVLDTGELIYDSIQVEQI